MNAEIAETEDIPIAKKQDLLHYHSIIRNYSLGFIIGFIFNIYGYFILNRLTDRKKKRKGVYHGCLTSIAVILFFCVFFLFYISYMQATVKYNKEVFRKSQRVKLMGFFEYIEGKMFMPLVTDKITKRLNQRIAYRRLTNRRRVTRGRRRYVV